MESYSLQPPQMANISAGMLLVLAAALYVLTLFVRELIPAGVNQILSTCNEIDFYWRVQQRNDQMQEIINRIALQYTLRGFLSVNIMVYNKYAHKCHTPVEGFVCQSSEIMGNVWGFRVEVFTGRGIFHLRSSDSFGNWMATGNHTTDGNVVTFYPV